MTSTSRRSVLVTGAAGGLGAAGVRAFLDAGWRVAAADLRAPDEFAASSPDDVLPLEMDVTDDASVEAAIALVDDWSPRGLDAVVTYAGIGGIGPLMDTPPAAMAKVLDVNVLGTHRTVRASWPLIHRAGGRIILIGSETGWMHAMPLNGTYAMSKHAIEAYADALRREVMFVGGTVVLLQPGPFRSAMTSEVSAMFGAVAEDSMFKPLAVAATAHLGTAMDKASDPAILAAAVVDAATTARPRTRYSVRPDRSRARLNRLPVPVVDRILKASLKA
ncbi:MAG: SDR family NAD(P)-dependent oxidoreductase [Mobilicoccus sp.]|nr:SDR family NAD(P)-dependent oxidoreductase [Mobilicoccus sp.]